jgi:hypothetical protein
MPARELKRWAVHCALPLLTSLFIYVFFRTQHTIVNEVLWRVAGLQPVHWTLPGLPWVVYNLPGALWMYAFMCFSSRQNSRFLLYAPLVLALGIEAVQLLHLTDGTFDPLDVLFYLLAWLTFRTVRGWSPLVARPFQPSTRTVSWRYKMLFAGFVAIVLLSDVWTR